MKILNTLLIFAGLSALLGCQQDQNCLLERNAELLRENKKLKLEVSQLTQSNEQLTQQIYKLSSLDPQKHKDAISDISGIEIISRSGIYDKNQDNERETLVVYLRVFDDAGDNIKIPGQVNIQLWQLANGETDPLLQEWDIEAAELKKMWAGTFMTNYYRFSYDIFDIVANLHRDVTEPPGELTVKVTFTDLIQGKTLSDQAVIRY